MNNVFELLNPYIPELRAYIESQLSFLRSRDVEEGLITTSDVLDELILRINREFDKKPEEIELKEWIYVTLDEVLKKYKKEAKNEKREKSFEYLKDRELRRLEEVDKLQAEADGKKMLKEDFDPEDNLLYDDDA